MKIKVGVIFGGETVEHEVSIITAVQAMEHINKDKYEVVPIYISKDRIWYTGAMLKEIDIYKDFNELKRYAKQVVLTKSKNGFYLQNTKGLFRRNITDIDIAFPIVHGNNAEDGTLQGYLDSVGIPYVGSRVLGSALGQDKVVMKQIFKDMKLPVVDYTWFFDSDYADDSEKIFEDVKKLGYPVIVKPATLGSSVGITYVKSEIELASAIEEAMKYDTKVVVESAVQNLVEVNCSVFGNYENQEASVIEEVTSDEDFLTYQDKYASGSKGKLNQTKGMASASRIIPARIDSNLEKDIKDTSKKAFRALNLSGVCRIDYLIDKKTNKFYINEPNTIPGSLAFYLWEPVGKKYEDLLDEMITLCIKDYKRRSNKVYSFESNILSNYGIKGLKGLKGIKK
ncbi:MAG: D-alanine--D-alanine ligase family protein [bacterium]|nr:D-alanine--D-alanine ligase family protein [bacterium]